ncbi:MAG: macro domain-containing protein [Puniceicoccales bacterium]|jgi:O-acetyl-ADP-ribose deacetylase (regulator of RNase III)|nr:macro domain-containing protein [Puniceicoccales bacterium]
MRLVAIFKKCLAVMIVLCFVFLQSRVSMVAADIGNGSGENSEKSSKTAKSGKICRRTGLHGKRVKIADTEVVVWKGDITTLHVDAIVNAANSSLLGGGGIDGAIHSAAGPQLEKECRGLPAIGEIRCEVGDAKITGGHNLPAKFVIHTVGPQVSAGHPSSSDSKNLKNCYLSCLDLCEKFSIKSIAFCCVSCGIYGFPNNLAAKIAFGTVKEYLKTHPKTSLDLVVFCVFSNEQLNLYDGELDSVANN